MSAGQGMSEHGGASTAALGRSEIGEGSGPSRGAVERPHAHLLRQRFARAALRIGWPGVAGLALAVVAVILGLVGERSYEAGKQVVAEERAALLRGDVRSRAPANERETVAAFYDRLPPVAALPERLRRLHDAAEAHGVALERTDYRSAAEPGAPLVRVTLILPVRAEFANLYRWLDALLRDMPEVAVESLRIERETTATTAVDADIRLALYLRTRS